MLLIQRDIAQCITEPFIKRDALEIESACEDHHRK